MKIMVRHMKVRASMALALLAYCGAHSTSYAQTAIPAPNVGDALHQIAPPTTPKSSVPSNEALPPEFVVEDTERPVSLPESEKLFVKSIFVEGVSDEENEQLQPRLAPYLNQELTMAEINEAARAVTRYFRNQGFLVARAYVPKQSSFGGLLTIGLQRGAYGDVVVNNSSLLRQGVVERSFADMKERSPYVTQASLERIMMLLKELPGGAMPNISLKSGKNVGTADLLVKMDKARRLNGYLEGDNQGSQFTGRRRAYGGLNLNSPFGFGDLLSVSAMTTEEYGLKNGGVSYALPLNHNGLRISSSYSQTRYKLGGSYALLQGTGSAKTIEGTLSYAVRRQRNGSIDISITGSHRDLHDDLATTDTHNPRNANLGTATVQRVQYGALFGRSLYTAMTASVTAGQLEVTDPTQKQLSGSDGTYGKLNFKFVAESQLRSHLSTKVSLATQKDVSNKVLDSSEQFFISGGNGVRAYAEGASSDNGYIANVELRYVLPKIRFMPAQQSLAAFSDNGAIQAQQNGTSLTNYVLSDAGASYSLSYRSAFANVQWAHSLGPIKSHNETDHDHIWLQVGYVF